MTGPWLLCSYRLPREPSRLRLAVWRRCKQIGALLIHDAVWALPASPKAREDFDWLAEDIEHRGGTVLIWAAESLPAAQDASLVAGFVAEQSDRYALVTEAAARLGRLGGRARPKPGSLERAIRALGALERGLRLERRRDYFRANGRREAEAAIATALDQLRSRTRASTTTSRRARAVGN